MSTSRTATTVPMRSAAQPLITSQGWMWIMAFATLFVSLHYNFIKRMALASQDPNWQHILIVPLISAYFIFQNRERLVHTRREVAPTGLILLFLGIFCYAGGIYPVQNDMFQGYSMIIGLFGLVWFLTGRQMLRYLWFPIVYLVFAVKVADQIWNQIAWTLQDLAATLSASAIRILGLAIDMDVELDGNTIILWSGSQRLDPLNVAEACSGLRMLMAFVALGVAMAFLSSRPWWQRLVMVILAVPVAVVVNVGRVTVIGILYAKVDPRLASGDFHIFVGLLMLIPAAFLFLLLGWILDNIVIYDRPADTPNRAGNQTSDPVNASHPVEGGNDGPTKTAGFGLIVKGGLIGAALAATAGAAYAMGMFSILPDRLPAPLESLGRPVALVIFIVTAAVALLIAAYAQRRLSSSLGSSRIIAHAMAGGILLTAVLGLNGVVWATKIVLFKAPIPLRHRLTKLPRDIGSLESPHGGWAMVGQDERMPKDIEEALGTKHYISRTYVCQDNPKTGLRSVPIQLHVAYYTGTIDTVPHVPDRCLLAGGAQGQGIQTVTLNISGDAYQPSGDGGPWIAASQLHPDGTHIPNLDIQSSAFTFVAGLTDDALGLKNAGNVVYFFAANGKFLSNPNMVRFQAFDPLDKYAYFCKIEVGMPHIADLEEATRLASSFLSVMLPEIMACLPDWTEVTEGLYPPQKEF